MSSILFAIPSCRKIDENGFRTYTIKCGKHKSRSKIKTTRTDELKFQAIFDSSAIYTSADPINQYDINKLYGLSDCGSSHLDCSIRFGWRWYNDSLEILWFKHVDGKFTFDKIKTIDIDQIVDFSIKFDHQKYHMSVDNDTVSIDRPCSNGSVRKYYLWPYFGGDETAPHDITIKIKDKNM